MKISEDLIHILEQEYATLLSQTFAQVNEKVYTFNAGKMAMIDTIFQKCNLQISVGVKAGEKPPEKK